jgi:hypothetical protein
MNNLHPNQTLVEMWSITYTRRPHFGKHEARGDLIIAGTSVACSGEGDSIDAAKLDLLVRLAANYVLVDGERAAEGMLPMLSDESLKSASKLIAREIRRRRGESR